METSCNGDVIGSGFTADIIIQKEILSLDLAPEIVDPDDIETLSDIIIAGVNQAIKTVEDENAKAMSAITGSMSLPGLF